MNWIEIVSLVLNLLFGGGLLMLMTAKAKKDEAVANTDKIEMDNFRTGSELLQEAIVKPLKNELKETKNELKETREEMQDMQKEMRRLRRAIEHISECEHSAQCPVRAALNGEERNQ